MPRIPSTLLQPLSPLVSPSAFAIGLTLVLAAWVGALLTATWIVSVALTKSPAGFFRALL
jgi:hypothetical protein